MKIPKTISIIILFLALAYLLFPRYEVGNWGSNNVPYRFDRWTGTVETSRRVQSNNPYDGGRTLYYQWKKIRD